MKKLFLYIFLVLILNSCSSTDDWKGWMSLSDSERDRVIITRDARINLFGENLVYLGLSGGSRKFKGGIDKNWEDSWYYIFGKYWIPHADEVAIRKCNKYISDEELKKKSMGIYSLEKKAKKLGKRIMTKEETEKHKLWNIVYMVYECVDNPVYIAEQKRKKELLKSSGSINTLNRTFICKYQQYPDEKSKIVIRGNTAQETTAIGVIINYSRVEYNNGNFTLTLPSKQNRAWFISPGNFSTMLIGAEINMYNCN